MSERYAAWSHAPGFALWIVRAGRVGLTLSYRAFTPTPAKSSLWTCWVSTPSTCPVGGFGRPTLGGRTTGHSYLHRWSCLTGQPAWVTSEGLAYYSPVGAGGSRPPRVPVDLVGSARLTAFGRHLRPVEWGRPPQRVTTGGTTAHTGRGGQIGSAPAGPPARPNSISMRHTSERRQIANYLRECGVCPGRLRRNFLEKILKKSSILR